MAKTPRARAGEVSESLPLCHVAILLKRHMPDLTLSLVTNELSQWDGAANQGP